MQPSLTDADLVERPIDGQWQASEFLFGTAPPNPNAAELFAAWKEMSRQQFQATTDVAVLRDRLRRVFRVDLMRSGTQQITTKPGKDSPIVAVYSRVTPLAPAAEVLKTDRYVVMTSVYHADPALTAERSFHTYNLAEGVLQVHDILRAIESVPGKGTVEIVPVTEDMLVPALYASALSPRAARLSASNMAKATTTMRTPFLVPGIERVGGIDAALRVLGKEKGSR